MVELPPKSSSLGTSLALSTKTTGITYGETSVSDGGMSYFRFAKHDGNLNTVWRSPEVLFPSTVAGQPISRLVGNLLPLANGDLFGFFGLHAAGPFDLQFGSDLFIRCPTGSPTYSIVMVVLDDATGSVKWAHCLPGVSSTGVAVNVRGVERQGESIVLLLTTNNSGNGAYELGRFALPVGETSPVFLSLTPPR
jgi:hypothetical protein